LGKDLIDDAAGSGVYAPDDPALASDMIEENDPIPKYSQAVKALQFAFERPNVPFFVVQIFETPPDGPAGFGSSRADEIHYLLLQLNLHQAHPKRLRDNIFPRLFERDEELSSPPDQP
jgi:hypothetical protein